MFKASLQDVSVLRDSLDAIASLVSEGCFKISSNGIELIAMDPASVAMVSFKALPSMFLEYECDKEEQVTLNLANFVSILKRVRPTDKITMELTESKFKIKMVGDFKRNFAIPIIDTPPGTHKIPDLTFKSRIELFEGVMKDGLKDASMVSDCVVFEDEPNAFHINSFGDLSETKLELAKGSPSLLFLESEGAKSKYSIDYLDRMLKGTKASDKIHLNFSTDYPLKIECNKVDAFQLSFILAPRVDTD